MKKRVLWSVVALGLSMSFLSAYGQNLPIPRERVEHHKSEMAELADTDVAMSMYGQDLSWGELKRLMKRDGIQVEKLKGTMLDTRVRNYIDSLIRRVITLHEARQQNMVLTTTERADYYMKYKKELEYAKVKEPFQEFIKKFPRETVSLFDPCFDDLLLIAKFNEVLVADVTATDAEIEEKMNRNNSGMLAVKKFNEQMRADMNALAANPAIKTDEGFAKLAREHSEGTEAKNGGMMGVFPRSVIASACGVEEFNYQAGETTPLLETQSAFRFVRVHEVIPPEKEGEDDKLRISQILKAHFPEQKKMTMQQARTAVLRERHIETIKNFGKRQLPDSKFACPLFPKGVLSPSK